MDQKTESKRIKRFYIIIILFCITGKSAERHILAVLKISEKTFTVHKRRESKKASYIYRGYIHTDGKYSYYFKNSCRYIN